MKKILFLLTLVITSCCETKKYDYLDIETNKFISWNDVFNTTENGFFYFFSYTCSNCNKIKNETLKFLIKQDDYYLIAKSDDICYVDNVNSMIGVYSGDQFAIIGFPTLMVLKHNRVYSIFSGANEILNYIH